MTQILAYDVAREWGSTGTSIVTVESLVSMAEEGERRQCIVGVEAKLLPAVERLFSHHRTTNVADIAAAGEQVVSTALSSGGVVPVASSSGGVQTERLLLFDFAEDREMRVGLAC
ncbi:Hypothetical predicted protein [Olea europaea subsp. europaea]|uniref:Uncharacterized protein n=1 Tax=Olea europaea subsp. europaea TaxID=158383 RepID=A0A8S0P7S0_OLEEU|nr:Hypothetical predicted protein [Olea europaea subsp. europaea]